MTNNLTPSQEKSQLQKILQLQRQNDIIAMLLDGKGNKEIIEYISVKYGAAAKWVANRYIPDAQQTLRERKNFEVKELVMIHLARYEFIYNKLVEIKAQGLAMKALAAKE